MELDNYQCTSCSNKGDCEHLKKLEVIVSGIEDISYPLRLCSSQEFVLTHTFALAADYEEICISCGAIKEMTEQSILSSLMSFINSEDDDDDDDDEDDEEEDDDDDNSNLSREEKIEKIREILKLKDSIEIVESSEVNGHVKSDGTIVINSAALDTLDFDEIAFLIAHEKGHINCGHVGKKAELIEGVEEAVASALKGDKSLIKRLVDVTKIGFIGGVSYIGLSHLSEIEADIEAKKILKEANFSEDGGEKTLSRYDNGLSLTHPSSKLRRRIIKGIY